MKTSLEYRLRFGASFLCSNGGALAVNICHVLKQHIVLVLLLKMLDTINNINCLINTQ